MMGIVSDNGRTCPGEGDNFGPALLAPVLFRAMAVQSSPQLGPARFSSTFPSAAGAAHADAICSSASQELCDVLPLPWRFDWFSRGVCSPFAASNWAIRACNRRIID